MIREEIHTYLSADGKTKIAVKLWRDDSREAIAVLQIAHGMVEHKERYDRFAGYMAEHGFIVCANDHLGHGDSVLSEDKLGFFTIRKPSAVLVEDMDHLRRIMQKKYPDLPYIMAGHSMGSYLLRRYLSEHGQGLAGAVIIGTGYEGYLAPAFGLILIEIMARIYGWDHRSKLVQGMTYTKPYKGYALFGEDLERNWLTRDLDIAGKYYKDPKCTYLFTLSGYKGLLQSVLYTARRKNIRKIPKELPMLLVSGAQDPVGNRGTGVKAVYSLFRKEGLKTNMVLYDNCRHEILNELNYQEIYEEILTWILNNCLFE